MSNYGERMKKVYTAAIRPAAAHAYKKAENLRDNTEMISVDPSEKCFTYKTKTGFGFNLDLENSTVTANWSDMVLSFCWSTLKFDFSSTKA